MAAAVIVHRNWDFKRKFRPGFGAWPAVSPPFLETRVDEALSFQFKPTAIS